MFLWKGEIIEIIERKFGELERMSPYIECIYEKLISKHSDYMKLTKIMMDYDKGIHCIYIRYVTPYTIDNDFLMGLGKDLPLSNLWILDQPFYVEYDIMNMETLLEKQECRS